MQPHDKHAKSIKSRPFRARLTLKNSLGWLYGYPTVSGNGSIEWQYSPEEDGITWKSMVLDRKLLQESELTLNKTCSRYKDIILDVIPEGPIWVERVRKLLDLLKQVVLNGVPASEAISRHMKNQSRQANRLLEQIAGFEADMRMIAYAFAWFYSRSQDETMKALDWLVQHLDPMKSLTEMEGPSKATLIALQAYSLAKKIGFEALDSLVHFMTCKESRDIFLEYNEDFEYLLKSIRELNERFPVESEAPNKTYIADKFRDLWNWIVQQDESTREDTVALVHLAFNREVLAGIYEDIIAQEKVLVFARRKLKEVLATPFRSNMKISVRKAHEMAKTIVNMVPENTARFGIEAISNSIHSISGNNYKKLRKLLIDLLPSIPSKHDGNSVRAFFLVAISDLAGTSDNRMGSIPRAEQFAELMTRYIKKSAGKEWFRPWKDKIDSWNNGEDCVHLVWKNHHYDYNLATTDQFDKKWTDWLKSYFESVFYFVDNQIDINNSLVPEKLLFDLIGLSSNPVKLAYYYILVKRLSIKGKTILSSLPAAITSESLDKYLSAIDVLTDEMPNSSRKIMTKNDCSELLATIATQVDDSKSIAEYYKIIQQNKLTHVDVETLKFAIKHRESAQDFVDIIKAIQNLDKTCPDPPAANLITDGCTYLSKIGKLESARRLIHSRNISSLLNIGKRIRLLAILNLQPTLFHIKDRQDPLPEWALSYPVALHAPIQELIALAPHGKTSVERILQKDFPAQELLDKEIITLREKHANNPNNSHIYQRLTALEIRKNHPTNVSNARLTNLAQKIMTAADRSLLMSIDLQFNQQFTDVFKSILSTDTVPDWLFEKDSIELFDATRKLSNRFRILADSIFSKRCGPEPWHFYDMPANKNFIKKIESYGINTKPWTNPTPNRWMIDIDGSQRLELNFESDPLEVMRMGDYFGTCLSLGSCNFFSTLTNFVDINKQVIFARDQNNKVVGRCLIALTDNGSLIGFHPYCQNRAIDFRSIIAKILTELSKNMGASIAHQGKVPLLVGPDWYDDGPEDITGKFDYLEYNSVFRQSLSTIPVAELMPTLTKLCGSEQPDPILLGMLIELPELNARPELITPLLPLIESNGGVSSLILRKAGVLSLKSGNMRFISNHLSKIINHNLMVNESWSWYDDDLMPLVKMMADLSPSLVLRWLRQSRDKNCGSDLEETVPNRRTILATVHRNLGRRNLAKKIEDSLTDK